MGDKTEDIAAPFERPPARLDHSMHKALAGATREIRAVKIQLARMKLHSRSRD